ncbi:MAG: hypothetical protein HQL03_03460 [Nitrospirae bacterium]|nr:hypothetical protein [Nitrospirota bacterium]
MMSLFERRGYLVFLGNISLTLKIAAIMVVLGVTLLSVLSNIHGKMMSEIFDAQLHERLEARSNEDSRLFENYFLSYQSGVGALASSYGLIVYVKNAAWDSREPTKTDELHDIPPWLPKSSVLKFYVGFNHAILYDRAGRSREVYNATDGPPLSARFSDLAQLPISPGPSYFIRLDSTNYVLSAREVKDADGNKIAVLVITHPINDELLIDAMGPLSGRSTVVLASSEDHTVIATNRPELIKDGTTLGTLNDKFMFKGKHFLDSGEDEVHMMFVSLISFSEVNELRSKVLSDNIRFNIITAVALILSFIVIMLYITMRIRRLDNYVSNVSRVHLAIEPPKSTGGDQLRVLEERFRRLFDEIIESKSLLEKRALDLEDINRELKETTVQLIQTEKFAALGELTAGVAHEINQPLNGIKIICQSISKDIQKNRYSIKEMEPDLADIVEQVDRMAAIIDHMRIFTRRSETMNLESTDINTIVEGAFKLLHQQLINDGINVTKNLAPNLPQINGDITRLEQVFINLIVNAKNAMTDDDNADKNLKITTSLTNNGDLPSSCDGAIVIEVENNGTSIPESIIDKIFQPFSTTNYFMQTNEQGKETGIGLPVSKKIIDDHGGNISVQSNPGRTTIFKITLPIADNKPQQTNM